MEHYYKLFTILYSLFTEPPNIVRGRFRRRRDSNPRTGSSPIKRFRVVLVMTTSIRLHVRETATICMSISLTVISILHKTLTNVKSKIAYRQSGREVVRNCLQCLTNKGKYTKIMMNISTYIRHFWRRKSSKTGCAAILSHKR